MWQTSSVNCTTPKLFLSQGNRPHLKYHFQVQQCHLMPSSGVNKKHVVYSLYVHSMCIARHCKRRPRTSLIFGRSVDFAEIFFFASLSNSFILTAGKVQKICTFEPLKDEERIRFFINNYKALINGLLNIPY